MARSVPPNPTAPLTACAWCEQDLPGEPIHMPSVMLPPPPGKRWIQQYPFLGCHGHRACLEKHGIPLHIYGVGLRKVGPEPAPGEHDARELNFMQALREETVKWISAIDRLAIEAYEAEVLARQSAGAGLSPPT